MDKEKKHVKGNGTSSSSIHWCRCCRRHNEMKGNSHNFTPTHQQKLINILTKQLQKISGIKYLMELATKNENNFKEKSFWCFCCELEIQNSKNKIMGFETIKHLASKKHQKALEIYFRETGVPLLKGKFEVNFTDLLIKNKDYVDFLKKIKEEFSGKEEEETSSNQPLPVTIENGVLNQIGPSLPPLLSNSQTVDESVVDFSVVNSVPLPTFYSLQPEKTIDKKQSESKYVKDIVTPIPSAIPSSSSIFGFHLKTIKVPELKPGEGNVYNGGIPPWLLDENGNIRNITISSSMKFSSKLGRSKKSSSKLGSNMIRPSNQVILPSSTYLPNFGRLWQSGSRLDSKQEFLKEMEKSNQDPLQKIKTFQTDTEEAGLMPPPLKNTSANPGKEVLKLFK